MLWVYCAFERKFGDAANALADWMLAQSSNPWAPFGRYRGSAGSITEFRILLKSRPEFKKQTELEELRRAKLKAAKMSDNVCGFRCLNRSLPKPVQILMNLGMTNSPALKETDCSQNVKNAWEFLDRLRCTVRS